MIRPYYPALDALWMMERHGMTFEEHDGDRRIPVSQERLRQLVYYGQNWKVRPDAAGIAMLEPREGDIVSFDNNGFLVCGIWCGRGYIEVPERHNGKPFYHVGNNEVSILKRNNLPFIMPQYEDGQ